MRTWHPDSILWAWVAAGVAVFCLLPAAWPDRVGIGLTVMATGFLVSLIAYVAVQARVQARRIKRFNALPPRPPPPPSPPTACPACGGTDHEYIVGGLLDGAPDPVTGYCTGWTFGYGLCKGCGSRWAQWDDDPSYVPSDEEWEREVNYPE